MIFFAALLFSLQINGGVEKQPYSGLSQEYFAPYMSVFSDHLVKNGKWQGLDYCQRLSPEEIKILKKFGQERMFDEFKRVLHLDYDKLYKENCVDKKLLAQDVLLKDVEEKVAGCEVDLQQVCSYSNWDRYKKLQRYVFEFLRSHRDGRIFVTDNKIQHIADDAKRIGSLLGVHCDITLDMSNTVDFAASGWKHDEQQDNLIPTIEFNKSVFTVPLSCAQQMIVGHEIAHVKERHHADAVFAHDGEAQENLRSLKFYHEKHADILSATLGLGFARQFEHFTLCCLKKSLAQGAIHHLFDNTPQEPLAHTYGIHPTHITRHIYATHLLGLMEAEARWWRTGEASERYGDVAYERAYQEWAKQQEDLKKRRALEERVHEKVFGYTSR